MGGLALNTGTEYFTKNAAGVEVYSDKQGYTGTSIRYNTSVVSSKWGNVKAMPMFNFNQANEVNPNLRITASSPSVPLGKIGNTSFSGSVENRTTLKMDSQFNKTDLVQEPRAVFGVKNGDWSASVIPRAKFAEKSPRLVFNGGVVSVQKTCGKFTPYVDTYLPREVFTKGEMKAANFALGVSYRF